MEKEFIPYEQALALKELGFDEPCMAGYDISTNQLFIGYEHNHDFYTQAPLYQQAFRWFREKYGYDISIIRRTLKAYKFEIQKLVYEGNDYFFIDFSFETYEEAELECLKKLIEICKNN